MVNNNNEIVLSDTESPHSIMADVRALLRSERASRRLSHPQASYTSTGQLSCALCYTPVKSEALWDSHLCSAGHVSALKQAQKAASAAEANTASRKRKASEEQDDQSPDQQRPSHTRKKSRGDTRPKVHFEDETEDLDETTIAADVEAPRDAILAPPVAPAPAASEPTVDEDEWAAFERDIAVLPTEDAAVSSTRPPSSATISAAPMTAEELQDQARKAEDKSRREDKAAEMEAEKEDAERALEAEFDEMEALEARVKRLREMREKLRNGGAGGTIAVETELVAEELDTTATNDVTSNNDEDDDEDEDDSDSWDVWRT
jgi:zinc finger protein 830